MAKFWFKVLILAACLGGVIAAQMYLGGIAKHGTFQSSFFDFDRDMPPLEVETQPVQALNDKVKEESKL